MILDDAAGSECGRPHPAMAIRRRYAGAVLAFALAWLGSLLGFPGQVVSSAGNPSVLSLDGQGIRHLVVQEARRAPAVVERELGSSPDAAPPSASPALAASALSLGAGFGGVPAAKQAAEGGDHRRRAHGPRAPPIVRL